MMHQEQQQQRSLVETTFYMDPDLSLVETEIADACAMESPNKIGFK